MSIAYEAVNENPQVFCAYGRTPAKALRAMSKLLKEHNVDWWSAATVGKIDDEENMYHMTIYI